MSLISSSIYLYIENHMVNVGMVWKISINNIVVWTKTRRPQWSNSIYFCFQKKFAGIAEREWNCNSKSICDFLNLIPLQWISAQMNNNYVRRLPSTKPKLFLFWLYECNKSIIFVDAYVERSRLKGSSPIENLLNSKNQHFSKINLFTSLKMKLIFDLFHGPSIES